MEFLNAASITAIAIFAITFFFILTERIHRTVIGFAGAVAMILAGHFLGFYTPDQAIEAIDFNTIWLLFGMMVIVVIMEKTGFFQYLGILTAKKTKGNPWLLLIALGTLTAALSMILDNVTTIILIVPVTIIVCRMLELNPMPILLAEAILSNVGGTATLVGDPPNIMIGSAAGFSFNAFLVHSLPVVVLVWGVTLLTFRFIFSRELHAQPQHIEKLMQMNENEAITDPTTLKKVIGIMVLVVLLFFTHSIFHLEASIVALIGAALAFLLVQAAKDPQEVIQYTELSVLLFFTSLFIIVGGLEHAGVMEVLAQFLVAGAADNLLMTALIVLWASAFLSAIVDNIPLTVAMIPIIAYLETQGVAVDLLWWALVFGVGFGGNGSPIGSTAGIIVTCKSEQTDQPITFGKWLKTASLATFAGLVMASIAIILYHQTGFVSAEGGEPVILEEHEGAPAEAEDSH